MTSRRVIAIIDSGIGGITVAVPLAQQLRTLNNCGPVDLEFIDVKPRRGGYNDLPPLVQVEQFLSDLDAIRHKLAPDLIAIACNTLTAVYEAIADKRRPSTPVLGIIEPTCQTIAAWLRDNSDAPIRIFGTPTTIRSNSYPAKLYANPNANNPIISIACPGLPGLMESGAVSNSPQPDFQDWIAQARDTSRCPQADNPGLSVLACTHFALALKAVESQLHRGGLELDLILNPNDAMISAIRGTIPPTAGLPSDVKLKLSSLHGNHRRICPALEHYLGATAPTVLDELRHGT